MQQLRVLRNNSDIPAADYKILKNDFNRWELECMVDRSCFSASDFQQVKGDLRQSENVSHLKDMRDSDLISGCDKYGFEKCKLEAVQTKGFMSSSDLRKLKRDPIRRTDTESTCASTCELTDMQEKCVISAADLPRLLCDSNKLNWGNRHGQAI